MPIIAPTTQNFVPIKEIRDGIVVLKDNSMRMLLMVSSVNFALKSEDEQKAVLLQFQNFLNSLDFPVQIFIQSRQLDIRPYLSLLEEQKRLHTSDLMKIQITEYVEFIKQFTENVSIMTKTFFVVVPYTPPFISKGGSRSASGFLGKVFQKKDGGGEGGRKTSAEIFDENRTQLEQRASVVTQGLTRTGVRAAPLGTEELVELYYKIFNPGEQEKPIPLNQ
jgi:hypothetical protein